MSWDATGTKRSDGLFIGREVDSTWTIFNKGSVLFHCPCCLKVLSTDRIARMVADVVWPEKDEKDDK